MEYVSTPGDGTPCYAARSAMNPILADVPSAFRRVAGRPRSIAIDRKGVVLPRGGHFQGIQRLAGGPPRLVITSSSDSQAYFVTCAMSPDGGRGRARPPVSMAGAPLKHGGGCQTVGSFLVAGVEDDVGRRTSEVQFWDLRGTPVRLTSMTIRRSGAPEVSTAGAVGLSSLFEPLRHGRPTSDRLCYRAFPWMC
jgi:hypothetical protein